MTKREHKAQARIEILLMAQLAFDEVSDPATLKEMDLQFRRIETLFGFVPGSWGRGS